VNYLASAHADLQNNLSLVDFVEISPEDQLDAPGALGLRRIAELSQRIPIKSHGRRLSIASAGQLDAEHLDRVAEIVALSRSCFYSDHLAFMQADSGFSELHMAPPYVAETLDIVVPKVVQVQKRIPVPFLLENVPNLLLANSAANEGVFFRQLCTATNVGILLNLDALIFSADAAGRSAESILDEYPKNNIVAVTLVPHASMNETFRLNHGDDTDSRLFDLLAKVLRETPARAVVVQRRYDHETLPQVSDILQKVRGMLASAPAVEVTS